MWSCNRKSYQELAVLTWAYSGWLLWACNLDKHPRCVGSTLLYYALLYNHPPFGEGLLCWIPICIRYLCLVQQLSYKAHARVVIANRLIDAAFKLYRV